MADTPIPAIDYAKLATHLLNIFRSHTSDLRVRVDQQASQDVGNYLALEVFSLTSSERTCRVFTEFPLPENSYIYIDASLLTNNDSGSAWECLIREYNDLLKKLPFTFEPPSSSDLQHQLKKWSSAKIKNGSFALKVKLGGFHSATEECTLESFYPAAILDQLIDTYIEKPYVWTPGRHYL